MQSTNEILVAETNKQMQELVSVKNEIKYLYQDQPNQSPSSIKLANKLEEIELKNKILQNENENLSDKIVEITKNKSEAQEFDRLKRSMEKQH